MSRFPPGVPTDVWEPDGEPVGLSVVLPGRGYPPAAPGLAYAGYVLRAAGWRVRDVWWDPPANGSLSLEDEVSWVGDQLRAATDGVDGPVLVVGKSLGTYAARLAAERSYPAIWLTPLLTDPVLVAGIRANPARQLLVGGTADRLWDADVAASLAADGCDVLQIDGIDHGLIDPADPLRSAEALVEITRAMAAFVAG
jgi:predicted alpha/beta-hydrolase family hydrolase